VDHCRPPAWNTTPREERPVSRDPSTTEAIMTDPTTPEGQQYWQDRHDYEQALQDQQADDD
jgi:hypothetical protein